MAEVFLEEIYEKAMIIEYLKEAKEALYKADSRTAKACYNKAALGLVKIISELSLSDSQRSSEINSVAEKIAENWNDSAMVTGLIEGWLLPSVFEYLSHFTGINVNDNGYQLKSADSGFLTIRDSGRGMFIHDFHDPMWEARRVAEWIFRADKGHYLIFGCGLGYLPYALWEKSGGAISFTIYEDDPAIIGYARLYGVLDWIPKNAVKIVSIHEKEKLLYKFVNDYTSKCYDDVFYITKWKNMEYAEVADGGLSRLYEMLTFNLYAVDNITINIRKNRSRANISFSEIRPKLNYDEWIIVAAGPSLDENIEFLRESIGKRGIVAVNTSLGRLLREGIKPDVVTAADTNEQLVKHIEGIEDATKGLLLIADEATSWKYTERFLGEICLVITPAGEGISISNPDKEDVWDIMGTVSSLAMETALRFGAKKEYLLGLDLGYPQGHNYAAGMPHDTFTNMKGALKVESVDGSMIDTSVAFNMFRIGIEEKISKNSGVEFINMSAHGALIKGARKLED